MKVLLVDNLVMPEDGSLDMLDVHPHLGLLALAGVAEADGHSVRIYDPKRLIKFGLLTYDETLYERAADELLAEEPDIIGFTALGCSFLFALNVAALIKLREPELPILLGGPHATMLHRQILEQFNQFDLIVRYEADETFPAVLDNLGSMKLDTIPGVSWRKSGSLQFNAGNPTIKNLDSLPVVNYDHYPISELGLDLLRIEAGRGCPFRCTFCSTATFFQRSFRLKSAERLVSELDRLHTLYGFCDFKLDHDLFTVNRRKILEFCEAVNGRGYRWRASARVDCVDDELLEKMAEAGCVGLYFGIETGSKRMQEIAKKRLDLDLVEPTLATCEQLGIATTASFITGYPEELEQDQAETLDMIGQCFSSSCLTQLHMLAPEPGTPMFDQLGDALSYDGYAGPYNAFLVGADDERLVMQHPDIFSTYHYYEAAMPRLDHIFAVEAVDVLRRTGPVVLKYLLRAYEDRLSKLIFALRSWAHSIQPSAEMVETYFRETFGDRDHLTSLIRYTLCVNGRQNYSRASDESCSFSFDPDQPYVLSSDFHVLHEIHDFDFLLSRIQTMTGDARLLEPSEVGELGICFVSFANDVATTCRIDTDIEAVLDLFVPARSCSQVAGLIHDLGWDDRIDASYFAPFVEAGILVVAEPVIASA
jgi:radical SAM superfamily enzyme YgiQ (UPF0313 family)